MTESPQQFKSPTGTWDEWLLMRSSSADHAEVVATMLRQGLSSMIDFGFPPMREGIRQLLSEFEQATEGQQIIFRRPEPPKAGQVEINVRRVDDRVRLIMGVVDHGEPVATDLPVDKAIALVKVLMEAIESAGQDHDDADGGS